MKQLPGRKNDAIIRVQMDQEELNRLLGPILKEVNGLRRRVEELESGMASAVRFAELTAEVQKETNGLLTMLVMDYHNRQDDGK